MYSGPKLTTDGLVFGYDTGYPITGNHIASRHYKGKPTVNVITNTNLDTGWSKGYQTAILYDEIAPPKGIISQVVGFNKNNSSSYWYSYGDYAPQTPNTTYTVSMYVKTRDSNFRIRFYTANNSETGRVWGAYITVPNDNQWHRIVWPSFLNPSNSQSDSLSFNFVMADTGDSSRTWFCAPQMEVGSIATPFINGTRSSTQSLIDLKRTTGIDITNLSFNSSNHPIFDGTNDRITGTWPSQFNIDDNTTPRSWEVVFKSSNTGGRRGIFGHKISSGCSYFCNGGIMIYDGRIVFNWYDNATYRFLGSTTSSANVYYHVVATFDSSGVPRLYVNGELDATYSSTNLNYSGGMGMYDIGWNSKSGGQHYFTGEIPVVKFYKNKELSANEIQQNFLAYKGRFNI